MTETTEKHRFTFTKRRIVFSFVIDEDPDNPIDPNDLAFAIMDQSDYVNIPRQIMDIEYVDNETIEKGDDEKLVNKSWNWYWDKPPFKEEGE